MELLCDFWNCQTLNASPAKPGGLPGVLGMIGLGGLPKRLERVEVEVPKRLTVGADSLLHRAETPFEFSIGADQRLLGIDAQVPRQWKIRSGFPFAAPDALTLLPSPDGSDQISLSSATSE